MPLLAWTDKLSVGVGQLDDDHKRLVDLLNRLHDAMRAGHGKEALAGILDGLVNYTKLHFAREETLFTRTGYPGAAEHVRNHRALTDKVLDLRRRHAQGSGTAVTIEALQFLSDWLVQHIQGSDRRYTDHLNRNGIR